MNDTRTQLSNDDGSEKKQFAFVKKIKTRKLRRKMKIKLIIVVGFVVVALFLLAGVMINISKTSKDKYAKKVFDNFNYKNSTILAK